MESNGSTRRLWLAGALLLLVGAIAGWLGYGAFTGTGQSSEKPANGTSLGVGDGDHQPTLRANGPPERESPEVRSPDGGKPAGGHPDNTGTTVDGSRNGDIFDVRIWVTYADGEAFTGIVRVRLGTGGSWDIEVIADQPALVKEANIAKGLDVSLSSSRPGFVFDECEVSAAQLRQTPEVHCVIPYSDEPNGTITVDLGKFSAEKKLWLRIEDDTGYTVFSDNTLHGGGVHKSPVIRVVRAQRFRVVVIGDEVWQSEWIDLRAGENREVAPEPFEPATVTAQPVDESGAPLLASLLYRDTGLYRTDSDLMPNPGSAISGLEANPSEDGVATLTHLAPGFQTICIQGQGTEIVRFEIMLSAGRVFDLGAVTLPPAKGRIQVSIIGSESDAKFSLELLQPMSAPVMDPTPFSDHSAVVENLPLRRYTVAVKINATGRCYWKTIELTESSPHADIEFDVSKPPPDDE